MVLRRERLEEALTDYTSSFLRLAGDRIEIAEDFFSTTLLWLAEPIGRAIDQAPIED